MTTQVWYHSGFAPGNSGDSPLPKEPYIGYQAPTISTSNTALTIPDAAGIAVIETDETIHSASLVFND